MDMYTTLGHWNSRAKMSGDSVLAIRFSVLFNFVLLCLRTFVSWRAVKLSLPEFFSVVFLLDCLFASARLYGFLPVDDLADRNTKIGQLKRWPVKVLIVAFALITI